MVKIRPKTLTIAGFDPSGGAGILADIKTFEQNKTLGFAVITANTIQTESNFKAINWVKKDIILDQLGFLLTQHKFEWVKIGLVENLEVLTEIVATLKTHNQKVKIIWDPIVKASAGGDFNASRFSDSSEILSNFYAITPNVPEFKVLFGDKEAQQIATQNKLFVLLKGGHSAKKGKDFLFTPQNTFFPLNPTKVLEYDKHGTGCILSAAWLSYLSRGFAPLKALVRAKDYLEKRLESNTTLLAYHK